MTRSILLSSVPFVFVCLLLPLRAQTGKCPHYWTYDSNLFNTRCCAGQEFSYGHLTQFINECFVAPNNTQVDLPASYWRVFECLMLKTVTDMELTLLNFAKVMTQNLTKEVSQEIISKLTPDNNVTSIADMWVNYFEAEDQICHLLNPSKLLKIWDYQSWDPRATCEEMIFPDIRTLGRHHVTQEVRSKIEACDKKLFEDFDFQNFTSGMKNIAILVCDLIGSEIIQQNDLLKPIDYEEVFVKMLPKFWSQSVRDAARKMLPLILAPKKKLDGSQITEQERNEGNLEQVIQLLKNLVKKSILDNVPVRTGTDEFYENVYLLVHMMNSVSTNLKYLCSH